LLLKIFIPSSYMLNNAIRLRSMNLKDERKSYSNKREEEVLVLFHGIGD
jgi:hypothetical protein